MSDHLFHIDAGDYGVPSREELVALRIWDGHYHGINSTQDHAEVMQYIDRMGIEHVIPLDIGGWGRSYDVEQSSARDAAHRALLEANRDRISGIIRIDPSRVAESLDRMERWIQDGPAIGIKYAGGNEGGVTVNDPQNDPIIERADELDAVIYIHTWIKVGGDPRYPGGGNNPGESTPMQVAELAARFPDVPMICGHSGGDWELGARAVRPHENVYFEFSGSDPHSGAVDYAVNLLGADRIVWGGHGPSRCLSTELSKVLDADLTHEQRMLVFGRNLRRLAAPILRSKGVNVVI